MVSASEGPRMTQRMPGKEDPDRASKSKNPLSNTLTSFMWCRLDDYIQTERASASWSGHCALVDCLPVQVRRIGIKSLGTWQRNTNRTPEKLGGPSQE